MKVRDILTESEQTNEGPLRYLKRTLGKNTAMGKRAQLDVELEKEAKSLLGDFYAVAGNSPSGKMTVQGLADFLTAKGFANNPKQVVRYLQQDPTMGMQMKKAGRSIKKGFDKVKTAMKGKDTGIGKNPDQPEVTDKIKVPPKTKDGKLPKTVNNLAQFDSIQREYNEAMILEGLYDVELNKKQAFNAIKKFVQQGMTANVAAGKGGVKKSSYADADLQNKEKPKAKTDAPKQTSIGVHVDALKKAGFKLTDPDGKPV
jgi:hypothetical protein